jgi:hypothetical protein
MTYFYKNSINAPSPEALRAFPSYAGRVLEDAVGDITESGKDFMRGIVPHGETHTLSQAVSASGPSVIGDRIIGTVFVDPFAAPHADLVDRGTGVNGPYRQGVILTRPSKTKPNKPGVMSFQKNGEDRRARQAVKIIPSQKMERAKNFSGRTYDHMRDYTAERVELIAASSLPNYFRATGAR